ncbi:MAG: 3'-5' exonuclease [Bacteroidia bacterium]|jgi:DNA polymerase elongation subunit (family B)
MTLTDSELNKVIFLDIETVPQQKEFELLNEEQKKLWEQKAKFDSAYKSGEISLSDTYQRAGIYAEFGKIICISFGYVALEKGQRELRIKSISDKDEKNLLSKLLKLIQGFDKDTLLCAHNGKEFDFPYICRRLLINGLKIPKLLDLQNKKSWEVKHLDTMELWKFGDYKHYTSLDLLANIFNIESSKKEMDGSMVGKVYYEENNLKKIVEYCELDVWVLANVFLKLNSMDTIGKAQTKFI